MEPSSVQEGTEEGGDTCSLFLSVFANDYLANKISSYLTVADMMSASETCSVFYNMVRNSSSFGELVKLCLYEKISDPSGGRGVVADLVDIKRAAVAAGTQIKPFFGLSAIELDMTQEMDAVLQLLQENNEMLNKVAVVRVINALLFDGDDEIPVLPYIFANATISTFQIFLADFVCWVEFNKVFHETATVNKLQSLELLYNSMRVGLDASLFAKLEKLSTTPLRITKLVIEKDWPLKWDDDTEEIYNLIAANSASIQELSLNFVAPSVWVSGRFKTIVLPSLKKLNVTLTDGGGETDNFIAFVQAQIPLDELSIHVKERFDPKLMSMITTTGSNLKKLHIRAKIIGNETDVLDWGFLSGMKQLTEFSLIRPWRNPENVTLVRSRIEGTGVTFLRSLPPTLTHLKLDWIQNFWWDSAQEEIISEMDQAALLMRFPALRSLTVLNCWVAWNDTIFQAIINGMTKLRILEVSQDEDITDFGFTGRNEDGDIVGSPITALKGLTVLKISGNTLISGDALLHCISYPFLRCLNLFTRDEVLEVSELIRKNPSLEQLSVNCVDTVGLESELRTLFPRLSVINLAEPPSQGDSDSDDSAVNYDHDYYDYDYNDYANDYYDSDNSSIDRYFD